MIWPETKEEAAQAIREWDEKLHALHEARMRAHADMVTHIDLHRRSNDAYDKAQRDQNFLHHRLKELVEREAYEAVRV